uniref:uncharacterized protein LOC118547164 n=1 Tax=Halichoerus grypus TaxID=9711 RepID=UPI0016592DC7|nr:uncharacterized protein LOC118547164 [Halichoerus grypus]
MRWFPWSPQEGWGEGREDGPCPTHPSFQAQARAEQGARGRVPPPCPALLLPRFRQQSSSRVHGLESVGVWRDTCRLAGGPWLLEKLQPRVHLPSWVETRASRSQKRHPRSLHPPDLVHRAWPSSLDRPMLVNREFCEKGSGQLHATEHGSSAFRGQGRLRSYEFCTTCRVATAPRQSKVKIPPEGHRGHFMLEHLLSYTHGSQDLSSVSLSMNSNHVFQNVIFYNAYDVGTEAGMG